MRSRSTPWSHGLLANLENQTLLSSGARQRHRWGNCDLLLPTCRPHGVLRGHKGRWSHLLGGDEVQKDMDQDHVPSTLPVSISLLPLATNGGERPMRVSGPQPRIWRQSLGRQSQSCLVWACPEGMLWPRLLPSHSTSARRPRTTNRAFALGVPSGFFAHFKSILLRLPSPRW